MSAPYMPFYVADYLADTTHLTRSEHGAYLLLLMAMWRSGGRLPGDDARLARMAQCTPQEWAGMRDVILAFFQWRDGILIQKRLAAEYSRYTDLVERRSEGGKITAAKKARKIKENVPSSADAELKLSISNQNQNQNQNYNQNHNQIVEEPSRGRESFARTSQNPGRPTAPIVAAIAAVAGQRAASSG